MIYRRNSTVISGSNVRGQVGGAFALGVPAANPRACIGQIASNGGMEMVEVQKGSGTTMLLNSINTTSTLSKALP